MKTFIVNVIRIGYGFGSIEVQAKSPKQARNIALGKAGNYLYSEESADYKVNGVTEMKPLP
jgi:hypothetical protein